MKKLHECITIAIVKNDEGWRLDLATHTSTLSLVVGTKGDVIANVVNAINKAEDDYNEGVYTAVATSRHIGQA